MKDEQRRSRWMMRVREWDDRAHYPNVWHDGMPCQIFAVARVAGRLRLGDLIAIYYPASQRHPERSGRFLGISRVTGLRAAIKPGHAWIDLDTAFKFAAPLELEQQPSRVFLCCDPGWPGTEVELFERLFDRAVEQGFRPAAEESSARVEPGTHDEEIAAAGTAAAMEGTDGAPAGGSAGGTRSGAEGETETVPPVERDDTAEAPARAARAAHREHTTHPTNTTNTQTPHVAPAIAASEAPTRPKGRMFGGVDYSGDMRDPRNSTWLAAVELKPDDRLEVVRLEATGRTGLEGYLRDPDRVLMHVEAIGLDFPFGLPMAFAESLLGGPFPEEGWWALAKRLERLTRPEYLTRIQEFRDAHGEALRLTDEQASAESPLRRSNPDRGSRAFHGIRMIAEDRSRFAMRPFESAQGKLLLEVHPAALVRRIASDGAATPSSSPRKILDGLGSLPHLPVDLRGAFLSSCLSRRPALDAVIAARLAAAAVLGGETDKNPDELAPGEGERVRREGWIYGLAEPA